MQHAALSDLRVGIFLYDETPSVLASSSCLNSYECPSTHSKKRAGRPMSGPTLSHPRLACRTTATHMSNEILCRASVTLPSPQFLQSRRKGSMSLLCTCAR